MTITITGTEAMPGSTSDDLRLRILERIHRLPSSALPQLDSYVDHLLQQSCSTPRVQVTEAGTGPPAIQQRQWPHAPLHRLNDHGTFFVTAATLHKQHFFRSAASLTSLEDELLKQAQEHGWQLEAWAIFSNHYHFVAHTRKGASQLKEFVAQLHSVSAKALNEHDAQAGRAIWFNYWDTQLTFQNSYFARLNYVHQNAVRHGLVRVANQYRWCSAAWFERTAAPSQVATIYSFKTDAVTVRDEFEPILPE